MAHPPLSSASSQPDLFTSTNDKHEAEQRLKTPFKVLTLFTLPNLPPIFHMDRALDDIIAERPVSLSIANPLPRLQNLCQVAIR
jgi:hypothetical protein